jgi:predicted transcriptional regulator
MNKMKSLTTKQQLVKDFIISYQAQHNTRPTNLEIGQKLGVSVGAAQYKVDSLIRKKIISLKGVYIISEKSLSA